VPHGIGRSVRIVWIICGHTQVFSFSFLLDIISYAYHPSLCLHPSIFISFSSTSSVQSISVTANQPLSSSAAAKGVELLAQPSRGGSATYLLELLTLVNTDLWSDTTCLVCCSTLVRQRLNVNIVRVNHDDWKTISHTNLLFEPQTKYTVWTRREGVTQDLSSRLIRYVLNLQ
jgi:hypothetical protein